MQLAVRNAEGKETGTIQVADEVFGLEPHASVVHQVYLARLANRRAGTVKTKSRGEVAGSTVKLRRQKGLGRARLGSLRSPLLKGGGVVFGPRPRSFTQRVPKRLNRLALRSVLSARAREGSLVVVDNLSLSRPSTKAVEALLEALGVARSALLVPGVPDRTLFLSARNRPDTKTLPAAYLNVVDLLHHHALVMSVSAVRQVEALWGGERARRRRAPVAAVVEEPPTATVARRPRRRKVPEEGS